MVILFMEEGWKKKKKKTKKKETRKEERELQKGCFLSYFNFWIEHCEGYHKIAWD